MQQIQHIVTQYLQPLPIKGYDEIGISCYLLHKIFPGWYEKPEHIPLYAQELEEISREVPYDHKTCVNLIQETRRRLATFDHFAEFNTMLLAQDSWEQQLRQKFPLDYQQIEDLYQGKLDRCLLFSSSKKHREPSLEQQFQAGKIRLNRNIAIKEKTAALTQIILQPIAQKMMTYPFKIKGSLLDAITRSSPR
jgi:hypothetical protein